MPLLRSDKATPLGGPPYPSTTRNLDATVRIEMVGGDLKVRTETVQSKPAKRSATPRPSSSPERPSEYTKGSRKRLRAAVRGIYEPRSFLTFTFPSGVATDQESVRTCWDRLRRWLLARGASGVMTIEFTSTGRPHLHLVLDVALGSRELTPVWAKIVGAPPAARLDRAVMASWVHSPRRLAEYMSKPAQKTPPPGFVVRRWWSSFGQAKPTKPKLVLRGPRRALEGLLQRLWGQRPGGRAPRTFDGAPPPRFWVFGGVDQNWELLKGLGLVE